MMEMSHLSSQVRESIERRIQTKMRKFANLGVDSCLDIIRLENCEYVAELLAIEAIFPNYRRTAQDYDIMLRVCDQFCASGIPGLREWAIAELKKQQRQIQLEINDCQAALTNSLKALQSLEIERVLMADLEVCLCEEPITEGEFLSGYSWLPIEKRQTYANAWVRMKQEEKIVVDAKGYLALRS